MTHSFVAPVAMTPEQQEAFVRAILDREPGIYVAFSAGRRGAGSVTCQFCGVPLFCEDDLPSPAPEDHVWTPDEAEINKLSLPDQHEVRRLATECDAHNPGRETGPIYGPFEYAQITYEWLRVDEGEHLACWNKLLGDWVICDDGPYEGESYSDATIAYYGATTAKVVDERLLTVAAWSGSLHGAGGPRHEWCLNAAKAVLASTAVPPWPGRASTGATRLDTIKRLMGV